MAVIGLNVYKKEAIKWALSLFTYPYLPIFYLDTNELISKGKMRYDGADLRVLNAAEDMALTFCFDPGTLNTASIKIYVKFSSLPVGETTIYIYYGNASATSTSSGF
jgi:hypothetical protein